MVMSRGRAMTSSTNSDVTGDVITGGTRDYVIAEGTHLCDVTSRRKGHNAVTSLGGMMMSSERGCIVVTSQKRN